MIDTPVANARRSRATRIAIDVWQTPDAARAFLERPHQMLGGKTPLDVVLASDVGEAAVEGLLRALQYGSAV